MYKLQKTEFNNLIVSLAGEYQILAPVRTDVVRFQEVSDASDIDITENSYVSIFLFFNVFAVNMFLQYKKVGPWKDYLFGERVYVFLSLFAKSALAWQVFAGTLR